MDSRVKWAIGLFIAGLVISFASWNETTVNGLRSCSGMDLAKLGFGIALGLNGLSLWRISQAAGAAALLGAGLLIAMGFDAFGWVCRA